MVVWTDCWWAFAYPIYQVIGTFRHEAAHAIVAWLEGARIDEFVFIPRRQADGGFWWGYVRWTGDTTWQVVAAPYYLDAYTVIAAALVCRAWPGMPHWLYLNLVILGVISPLINSIYNWRYGVDVIWLRQVLVPWRVTAWFVLNCAAYAMTLIWLLAS